MDQIYIKKLDKVLEYQIYFDICSSMNATRTIVETGTCPICGKTGLKFGLPRMQGTRTVCANEYFRHITAGSGEFIIKLSQAEEISDHKLNLN